MASFFFVIYIFFLFKIYLFDHLLLLFPGSEIEQQDINWGPHGMLFP